MSEAELELRIKMLEMQMVAMQEKYDIVYQALADIQSFGCRMDATRRKEAGILGGK